MGVIPAAMGTTERRIKQLRMEPVGASAAAVATQSLQRLSVDGTLPMLHELMQHAVVSHVQAARAVPQERARSELRFADAYAHASVGEAQHLRHQRHIDVCRRDAFIRINRTAARCITTVWPASRLSRANFHSKPTIDSYGCSHRRWKT